MEFLGMISPLLIRIEIHTADVAEVTFFAVDVYDVMIFARFVIEFQAA